MLQGERLATAPYPAIIMDATAASTAKALIQTMWRFGNPNQILSDRGPQFVNALIKQYLEYIGTEHVTTMAYLKEENNVVERANKETGRHLRAIVFDGSIKHKWSSVLP
jgi:transposase InsO family protein